MIPGIYIFNGENARLPSGAFSELARADEWIAAHRLSGLLTWYPLDAGVYDYAVALHHGHEVPGPVHAAARAALGEQGLVELVGVLGYYTLVAMTLNAFEIGPPDGEPLELQP